MKTAVSNFQLSDNSKATAEKNGMSIEQFAASQIICGNKDVRANAECLSILKDRATAMAAFDRVSLINETDSDSPFIPSKLLIEAILG